MGFPQPRGTSLRQPDQDEVPTRMLSRNHLARLLGSLFVLAVLSLLALNPARADDNLFVVTGVPVDVRAATAAEAKKQALGDVQVTAFRRLAERLGGSAAANAVAGYDISTVGQLLRSLSIEEEHTGPGRYFAKLTVRFLPDKVRELFTSAGIAWSEHRSGRIVIVPLWMGKDGPVLWDDNLWRRAWLSLGAENALVPLLVPLGDLEDSQAFSLEDALRNDTSKLEPIRVRYQGASILLAVASAVGDNGIHMKIAGSTPLGNVLFDKSYTVAGGDVAAAAEAAARHFHAVLTAKWRAGVGSTPNQPPAESLTVAVPFTSQDEWNLIRSGLLATPGVAAADISSLVTGGGMVVLSYTVPFETLRASLYQRRLSLQQVSGGWQLQPF